MAAWDNARGDVTLHETERETDSLSVPSRHGLKTLTQPGDAHRMPASATRGFYLPPIQFRRDGGMGQRARGDDVDDRLPQVFSSFISGRTDRC